MKLFINLWRTFKTYPISIIISFIYLLFCGFEIKLAVRLANMQEHHVTLGEGLMFGLIFLIIFATIFFIAAIFYYFLTSGHKKFYGRLMLFIITTLVLTFIVVGNC
jgi:hypothetical protein